MTGFGYSMSVYVGPSNEPTKTVTLPYEGMFVEPTYEARDSLKRRWRKEEFHVEVSGKQLLVTRKDRNRGWTVQLIFKAFYSRDVMCTYVNDLDAFVQNEGSVVTIKLRPGQKLRCLHKALIFKEEEIIKTNSKILPIAKPTVQGKVKVSLQHINEEIKSSFAKENSPSKDADEESIHFAEFTNGKEDEMKPYGIVTIGVNYPNKVLYLSLGEFGNRLIFKKGAQVGTSSNVEIEDSDFLDPFQSFIGHGDVFIKTGPAVKQINLKDKESTTVRQDCVIAFTQDVTSSLQKMNKIMGIFDEKATYRNLIGPGIMWVDYRESNVRVESDESDSDNKNNDTTFAEDSIKELQIEEDESEDESVTNEVTKQVADESIANELRIGEDESEDDSVTNEATKQVSDEFVMNEDDTVKN
jgi:hypothetical protein